MPKKFRIGFDRIESAKDLSPVLQRRESKLWILWMLAPVFMLIAFSSGLFGECTGSRKSDCVYNGDAVSELEIGQSKTQIQQQVCRDGVFGGFKTRRAVLTASGEDYVDTPFCVANRSASGSESWRFVRPVSSIELHFRSGELTAIEEQRPFGFFLKVSEHDAKQRMGNGQSA